MTNVVESVKYRHMAPIPATEPAPAIPTPTTYDRFTVERAPDFLKKPDLVEADIWLKRMKKIFVVIRCTNQEKVTFAVYKLEGEVDSWWGMRKRALGVPDETITWDMSEKVFLEKYFPTSLRDQKEMEFMRLRVVIYEKEVEIEKFYVKRAASRAGVSVGPVGGSFGYSKKTRMTDKGKSVVLVQLMIDSRKPVAHCTTYGRMHPGQTCCRKTGAYFKYRQWACLIVDLVLLNMGDFDVILGMDWLAKNHATIDYFMKKVYFNIPEMEVFFFQGIRKTEMPILISALHAKHLIAMPLTLLLKKKVKFEWTEKYDQSFWELKDHLTTTPILVIPNGSGGYEVYCDASKAGLGYVLMQHGRDGNLRV
ncbi:hypothetical protein Nepgr_013413 [Nepenthes gracilis]|uniref:Reverse transcriptase/retrotransposon-derived protein RNase H-like domain-containing protein n=1 Tax=Nepenthes gracilis TaxID=150966 RepID=A0AAD3SI26_NEPGR|nr:hypothetical protein Nepgr_013413 [Nepenthes gracilis]